MNKKGVAVQYNVSSPKILGTAKGVLLKSMLEVAENHNIPVYQDADLTELLYGLPIDSDVPNDLFKAVAEVFAFCYRVNERFKNKIDLENGHRNE